LIPGFRIECDQPFRLGGAEEALVRGGQNEIVAGTM